MTIPPKYEDVMAQLETERARVTDYIAQRAQTELLLEETLGREAALREELVKLADDYCEKVDDILDLQQRLTVAEQRADDMVYALARIQGRAEMFIDDGMHMPTPSIEAIRDIAAKAALKPAEEGKKLVITNCKTEFQDQTFAYTWPPGEKPDFINATDDASMRDLKK